MILLHLDLETHTCSEQIRGVLAGNAGSYERRLGVAAVIPPSAVMVPPYKELSRLPHPYPSTNS